MSMPPFANMPEAKNIIARVLELKEQQDEVSLMIRSVYGEAKDLGFDRAALAQAVSAIRKRQKAADNNQLDLFNARNNAMSDYLASYWGAAS